MLSSNFVVQYSTNLAGTNWVNLLSLTNLPASPYLILLNNPPFLETPSACLKTAQQISPTNGVQTILILGEGVLMVFLGVDLWPVGVLQQNQI